MFNLHTNLFYLSDRRFDGFLTILAQHSIPIPTGNVKSNISCVNLTIRNKPRSFHNSGTFKSGLSDFHKMTLTVLKISFAKLKPTVLNYRNYKFFNNTIFRNLTLNKQRNSNLQISNKGLKHFIETCLSLVSTIAPLKSRFIRANQAPFINMVNSTGGHGQVKIKRKIS